MTELNKMKVALLTILISGLLSGFCFGQADTIIYTLPEIYPTFSYDTCTSLKSSIKNYFIENYKMPDNLVDNGYYGSVVIQFVVEMDGSIKIIKVLRGIDGPLDESILKFIKTMPKWNPGVNQNKTVRTKFVLPVSIHWLYGGVN